ncbi:MAG: glycosyltransferase [Chitinophagaceae bacterium]|nr:glycosyltransferase [Chitinophagaceae bacterium]
MISSYKSDFTQTPFNRKRIQETERITAIPEPVVSIITAFYNTGEIFLETMYSILRQTYPHFEWLIINDGSTNTVSLQLLTQAAQTDPRIRIIDNDANIGLPATRNHGVQCAKGRYLFFIDSDDMVEYSFLEKCLLCLELNPHFSFVSSHTFGFGAKEYVWEYGYLQPERFLEDNYTVNCFVCRRAVFDQLQYDNIKGGMEDWDFWLHAASLGLWGYTIPEFLYWYRERDDRAKDWPDIFDASKRQGFIDRLNEKYAKKVTSRKFDVSLSTGYQRLTNIQPVPSTGPGANNILFLLNYQPGEHQQLLIRDYLRFFKLQGASITILIHRLEADHYNGDFVDITEDIFISDHLCAKQNRQEIWKYLIISRNIQRVISINLPSDAQDLPFLKAIFPELQTDLILISLPKQVPIEILIRQYQLNSRCIDHIGASSHEIRFMLESNTAMYGKVYFFPPVTRKPVQPFSRQKVQQQKMEWGIDSAAFTIAFTGQIGHEHFHWLKALIRKLRSKQYDRFLFLFGVWGPALSLFNEFIGRNELPVNICLLPANPYQTLLTETLTVADCCLDISSRNGFTDSLREALRHGIPVLSIGNEGIKDIVDPQTGKRFIHYEKPDRLVSDLLATLSDLANNPGKMNRLHSSCLQKASTVFSPAHPLAIQFCQPEKHAIV